VYSPPLSGDSSALTMAVAGHSSIQASQLIQESVIRTATDYSLGFSLCNDWHYALTVQEGIFKIYFRFRENNSHKIFSALTPHPEQGRFYLGTFLY
jgi:hypothetical protein